MARLSIHPDTGSPDLGLEIDGERLVVNLSIGDLDEYAELGVDDCRALAAALVHFADEADRWPRPYNPQRNHA